MAKPNYINANVRDKIASTYQLNPETPNRHVEIEIRFGEFSIPKEAVDKIQLEEILDFSTAIEPIRPIQSGQTTKSQLAKGRKEYKTARKLRVETYGRIKLTLDETTKQGVVKTTSDTTDCISGTVRRTIDNNTGVIIWIRKRDLHYPDDNVDYRFRVSYKMEETIQEPTIFTPTMVRQKVRSSYLYPDGFQFDLTKVTTKTIKGGVTIIQTSYELELELVDRKIIYRKTGWDQINNKIRHALFLVQDSNVV